MVKIVFFLMILVSFSVCQLLLSTNALAREAHAVKTVKSISSSAEYKAIDYSALIGMPGFSDTLLKNHFKLYQGYVTNTNLLREKLQTLLRDGSDRTAEYAEMKRRFGWEFNGMRLHEYYFENLGGKAHFDNSCHLAKMLNSNFGGFDSFKKDFLSTGAMRGIGWVVLYEDQTSRKLMNVWINEHDGGHLAGCRPILVMDVFEHAYFTDYQTERAKYLELFFANINWEVVNERLIEEKK